MQYIYQLLLAADYHPAVVLDTASCWYPQRVLTLESSLTLTTSCLFSSSDYRFISQVLKGYNYTLQYRKVSFSTSCNWSRCFSKNTVFTNKYTQHQKHHFELPESYLWFSFLVFWWDWLFRLCSLLPSRFIHNSDFNGEQVIVSVVWLVKITDLHWLLIHYGSASTMATDRRALAYS